MRRLMPSLTLIILLLALTVLAVGPTQAAAAGSIRGTVFLDANGDGLCPEAGGETTVPDVAIRFATEGVELSLVSGADGTYGLVAAGQGFWEVTATPEASAWIVTSANPIRVELSPAAGLVQTGVDFCVRRGAGTISGGTAATSARESFLPAADANLRALAERSESLLTAPPPPAPPENLEAIALTPLPAEPVAVAEWLGYLNAFREMGGLAPLAEDPALTLGSRQHSRYMVLNDAPIAHDESPANPLYTPEGQQAARHSNIFATTQLEATFGWAINFWISAPFHLVPILDPSLSAVGFGRHNEAVGNFQMAAVLDVLSGRAGAAGDATYPRYFPADGASTWIVRQSLYEWPDPVSSCAGYARPTGPALVLQLGDGSLTPRVTSHAFRTDGVLLDSCRFDETTYVSSDPFAQATGRLILDERDAVVIMPRAPLEVGRSYSVEVVADGQTYRWSFSTRPSP